MPRYRAPPLTEIRQQINFTMDSELFSRVTAYHKAASGGGGRLAAETIRELLWTAVNAGDINSGILAASRIIGVKKAQAYVLSEVTQFLNELAARINRMAGEADANAYAEAQLAVQDAQRNNEGGQFG